LKQLGGLRKLSIIGSHIADISFLPELANLNDLNLSSNAITDIAVLGKRVSLQKLNLDGNQIKDIAPLEGLVNLIDLSLSRNKIEDISPLLRSSQNGSLGAGDSVNLSGNPLDLGENSQATSMLFELIAKNINVTSDSQFINKKIAIYVNGEAIGFPDQLPFLDAAAGRTFVPVRFVAEALGAGVEWQGAQQSLVISKGGKNIKLAIGATEAYVNGVNMALDAPARLVGGRTMVPLRFISEGIGAAVRWTPETSRIDISSAN
jgi:hypothetical protein